MDFGVVTHNTEYGIRPDVCAPEAEARGFESVWYPEHTHIPACRDTPYPLGGDLPKQYAHFMDLFVSMMAGVGATQHIKIGAGICLLMEHDPIVAAKAITVFLAMLMTSTILDEYQAAGVARVVQFLPPDTHSEAMAVMDTTAKFIERYR